MRNRAFTISVSQGKETRYYYDLRQQQGFTISRTLETQSRKFCVTMMCSCKVDSLCLRDRTTVRSDAAIDLPSFCLSVTWGASLVGRFFAGGNSMRGPSLFNVRI